MYSHAQLLNQLFKIVYDSRKVESIVAKHFKLKELLNRAPEAPATGGKWFEFAIETALSPSAGAMEYSGKTRTPKEGRWAVGKVAVRQRSATYGIEYAALSLARSNAQAFMTMMEAARNNIAARIADHEIKQFLGSNTGVLALVASDVNNSTTIPVNGAYGYTTGNNNPINWGAQVFRPGDMICIDPGGTTPIYRTVVSVSESSIVVNAAVSVTAGTPICYGEDGTSMDWQNSWDGLAGIYAAGQEYAGINPSSEPLWNPDIITGATPGTPETLTSLHINRAIITPEVKSGEAADTILANIIHIQGFVDLYEDKVMFSPGQFEGGMRRATWNLLGREVNLFFDHQVPPGMLFSFPVKRIERFIAREGRWLNEDGAELKLIQGTTSFMAVWVELANISTRKRNAFCLVKDIAG